MCMNTFVLYFIHLWKMYNYVCTACYSFVEYVYEYVCILFIL